MEQNTGIFGKVRPLVEKIENAGKSNLRPLPPSDCVCDVEAGTGEPTREKGLSAPRSG